MNPLHVRTLGRLTTWLVALLLCLSFSRVWAQTPNFREVKPKADGGDSEAQFTLGSMYLDGKGAAKNFFEAARWLRKSADQGHGGAQYYLGYMFFNGQGVNRNPSEAIKWYHKAAIQDVAAAQHALGDINFDGQIVVQDYAEAAMWYRTAAHQGYVASQMKLGYMLGEGVGLPVDLIEAHKWMNLAASKGNAQALRNRDILAQRMTMQQVTEAQKRATAFRLSQPQDPAPNSASGQLLTKMGKPKSTGSGFFVTDDGYLLTNYHVVEGANSVKVNTPQGLLVARVVKTDPTNDLALLKVNGTFKSLPVVSSKTTKLGEIVFTVGYPNVELQGFSSKFTKGEISSLSGAQDDSRWFQISVPVQPGNSGGPLVNQQGNVIGLVAARLNDMAGLQTSGALPQNVNYAVKGAYVTSFLASIRETANRLKQPILAKDRKFEEVVGEAESAAALVLVY